MGGLTARNVVPWDMLCAPNHKSAAGAMQVNDMLLKQAIEEKREQDARAVEAFGGHLADPEGI